MSYLIAILISLFLLTGFLCLVWYEKKKERRFFSQTRRVLDQTIGRGVYIARHIDWAGFFAHIFKLSIERIAHDAVHSILVFVRTLERTLTRAIKSLRERVARRTSGEVPAEGSQLVATIVKFRKKREVKIPEETI